MMSKMMMLFLALVASAHGASFDQVKVEGNLTCSAQTANTVPYFNGSKVLSSSAVTTTELGFLSGVTSSIQTQLNSKQVALGYTTVNKAGDTMTGQLILPSLKVDDGTGPALAISNDNVNSETVIEALSGGIKLRTPDSQFYLNGSYARMESLLSGATMYVADDGSAVMIASTGDTEVSNGTYGGNLRLANDGSVFLSSLGGLGRIWLDSYGETKVFFNSDGSSDFSVFNQTQGMTPIQVYGSGRVDISSANSERIQLTSAASLELNAVDYVSVSSKLVPNADGAYNLGESSTRWDSIFGGTTDTLNLGITGTFGSGFIALFGQNGSVAAGTGVRLYANNANYPVFKDPSNRSVTFSTNSISLNTDVELTIPNTNGTIATQAYVTANSVQQSNTTFSTFVTALTTLGLNNIHLYVYTGGSAAAWTLPTLSGRTGQIFRIKNRGSATITLTVSGGGSLIYTTSAVASVSITAGSSQTFMSDGTYWLSLN